MLFPSPFWLHQEQAAWATCNTCPNTVPPHSTPTSAPTLQRVKLEALRQELATHEATVAELRRMIAGLERELDG